MPPARLPQPTEQPSRRAQRPRVGDHAIASAGAGPRATSTSTALLALQRAAGNHAVATGLEAPEPRSPVLDVIGRGGSRLPTAVRHDMETRLGHDFSDVRIHTDHRAAIAARSIDAEAFTSGRDIAFAPGRFSPTTSTGRQTLAHELTHVVQQRAGAVAATPVGGGIALSHPADPYEREAEASARQAIAAPVHKPTGGRR